MLERLKKCLQNRCFLVLLWDECGTCVQSNGVGKRKL